jgi:hypothetical protein
MYSRLSESTKDLVKDIECDDKETTNLVNMTINDI